MSPYAHGTNARYSSASPGCRCDDCRRAHREASRDYRERGPVFVDAAPVRHHLRALSRRGIGIRSVLVAAGLSSWSLVEDVRSGKQQRISRDKAERLLAVRPSARLLVPARRSWQLIAAMKRLGLSQSEIATRLGYVERRPSIGRRFVYRRTERMIEALYREVLDEVKAAPDVCLECGYSHAKPARLKRLARYHDDLAWEDATEAWPCVYQPTDAGRRLYERDRQALRHVRV